MKKTSAAPIASPAFTPTLPPAGFEMLFALAVKRTVERLRARDARLESQRSVNCATGCCPIVEAPPRGRGRPRKVDAAT